MQKILTDIANATQTGIGHIRQILQRTTSREKFLIAVLALGAGLYVPVYAFELMNKASDEYITALGDQASARLAAQAARHLEVSAHNEAALKDMETWGIHATNAAVAQVLIEEKLVKASQAAGLVNPVITTENTVEITGPLRWIHAQVRTDLRWQPAFAFIDTLGEWSEGFRVVGFQYEVQRLSSGFDTGQPEQGTIHYSLAFPVFLEEAPVEATASPASIQGARG